MPRSRVRRKPKVPQSSTPGMGAKVRSWGDRIWRFFAFRGAGPAMPSLPRPGFSHIAAAAVAAAAYACVHGRVAWTMFQAEGNDYIGHVKWAEDLYRTGKIAMPHFLYYLLIDGVYAAHLAPSFLLAGRMVTIGAYVAAAALVYGALWAVFQGDRRLGRAPVLLAATGAVLVAQPIAWVQWYTIGYLWNDPYNTPTLTLLRPFAVAAFFLTVRFLFGRRRPDWRVLTVLFLAVAGGALAKPSYLICLLPATAILAALRIVRRAPLSPGALLIGFGLPAVAVLVWQYQQVFSGGNDVVEYRDTIVWAPLRVMHYYASGLAGKFLLSTAFPLAVLVLHWKTALRDGTMQLAWLTFGFGASYAYLLSEDVRWAHGNFGWSAYISLFVLFAASTVFWLRQVSGVPLRSWLWLRELVCFGALAAHVIAGVRFDREYLGWALRNT